MNPLITVGITCFNSQDTIRRALDSALSQDWENLEIIVVDDMSTDDSAAIVGSAIAGQKTVRLIRHAENTGPAGSRNTILDHAQGEFIVFFDDDDESLPDRVRLQYETLREYENETGASLVACYASGVRRYPNGYELPVPAIGSQPDIPKGELVADYLLFNDRRDGVFYGAGTPTCALMARLATFRALGGFDSSLRRVEDVDFAVRLALAGGHFIGCPQQLFVQHATVASDKTPRKNLEAELRLVDKNAGYLKRRNRYDYARHWFRIRYYHFSGQRMKFLAALSVFLVRYPVPGMKHLLRSLPGRWGHERRMRARTDMPR
jgi:glycosyltransferase involved in cell wall biosynthesis